MAIVDKKTPRLGLLLPNADNFLQDDVERLIQSFDLLDVLVVMRDQTTGKIADDQLSAVIARLDAQGKIATSALPSSVVQKGADGKIDASVLPSIAIIDSFPVPNEASMLGLQCERGDIAIRTDLGRSFILTDLPPSKLSNWRELTSTNVTSVNGQVGAVTGLAKSGANDDITSLNALSGPLRLGGEAAGDYDAVTLKQLRAASGGAGGASMNGVMNNFIGAVEWFMGTRAKLPAGYIPADGQKVLKTDQPDLWAAVNSKMLTSTNEATWQADRTKRACYAYDTSSTEFRVPDLNGQQSGSITGAFLRGHSSSAEAQSGAVGEMRVNAAPNITGTIASGGAGAFNLDNYVGAFQPGPPYPFGGIYSNQLANTTSSSATFDASRFNAAYGRDSTAEVRPNSAVGIWIIRASGTFSAQNTEFQVQTSDAVFPGSDVVINGGKITSIYTGAGVGEITSHMRTSLKVGLTVSTTIIHTDATGIGGASAQFSFDSDGRFNAPKANIPGEFNFGYGRSAGDYGISFSGNTFSNALIQNTQSDNGEGTKMRASAATLEYGYDHVISNFESVSGGRRCTIYADGGFLTKAGAFGGLSMTAFYVGFNGGTATLFIDSTPMSPAFTIASDRELKDDVVYVTDSDKALAEVNKYRPATFKYKERGVVPESDAVLGFIANDIKEISPDIVTGKGLDDTYDGVNHLDAYKIDSVGLIAKLVQSIQVLTRRIAVLEAKK